MSLRVVFMGTPGFSVPTLVALHSNFQVAGVVTQPDKPRGRGLKTIPTAVKKMAAELGLPVIEPVRIAATEVLETLHEWNPNIIVVAAYGKILPEVILESPFSWVRKPTRVSVTASSGSSSYQRRHTCR